MRPLELSVEGLRSFRSPVSIDFTGRDHVAIVGDTGAGKSSILEAITYALYGQTTFTAQANQELMNDTYTDLRVALTFRVSGETWEVARSLRRDRRGDVGQARALLRRIGQDGEPVEQLEQVRPVNERVEQLLGLDSDAFLRTVVLPQGRFARLLVEDRPTDRGRILRQVWRTDELEAAGEAAGWAREEAEKLRIRLEQAATGYPEDPEGHLRGLREALERARSEAAAAGADEAAARRAHEAVLGREAAREAADGVIERLRALDTESAADRLGPLVQLDRQFAQEAADLTERQERLTEALESIPTDDGPEVEEVTEALTRLEGLEGLVATGEEVAERLRGAAHEAVMKRAEAERLAEAAGDAARAASEHTGGRAPLERAARATEERRELLSRIHTQWSASADEAAGARGRLDRLREEEAERAGKLEGARETESRAARAAKSAEEHLSAAHRAESAASAAHDLHPGDACPICNRGLPADWKAPDGARLLEARQLAEAARLEAKEAAGGVSALEGELKGVRRRIGEAEAGLEGLEAGLLKARQELARKAKVDADSPVPERDALLGPLEAEWREASARLAEHVRVAEELKAAAARADKEAGVAGEGAANAEEMAEAAGLAANEALARLERTIKEVPRPFRPELGLPSEARQLGGVDTSPLARQTRSARERAHVLRLRSERREELRRDIEALREDRAALEGRRSDELDQPLEALARSLNAQRDVLVEAVGRLALDTEVPAAVAARGVRALESQIGGLRKASAAVERVAELRARESSAGADAARAELQGIGERTGVDAEVRDIDTLLAAVRTKATDARFEERRAEESERRFAEITDHVRRLGQLLREVQEKEVALGDLESALKPGAFLKWLTLRRSRSLLVHASRMLGEMSGGKYAFADPGEADEQWLVLDHDSGQARSPASLSGGEQFIASLALALGMVEMMARSGGRLESLFLDEGFGSLDRNNLDAAVQALATVATGGRMVGVISHVRAVAEQIEHVLAVTRDPTGSRAEWLTSRQRRRLSESDMGLEAISALSGLLE